MTEIERDVIKAAIDLIVRDAAINALHSTTEDLKVAVKALILTDPEFYNYYSYAMFREKEAEHEPRTNS